MWDAVARLIEAVEQAETLKAIPNVKKLRGEGNFCRVRWGGYRVGLTASQGCVGVTFDRRPDRR